MRPLALALVLAAIIAACSATSLKLSVPRYQLVSASLGSKVIFAGGLYDTSFNVSSDVDVCDQSKCTQLSPGLSEPRAFAAAAAADATVFISGGENRYGVQNTIDLCTTATCTEASFTLHVQRTQHVGATLTTSTNKQYALFVSGHGVSSAPHASAEICDSTGCTSISFLATGFIEGAAASLGNHVIIAGGQVPGVVGGSATYLTQVFKCNESGCSAPYANGLSVGRSKLAAASVGSGVIFAGGSSFVSSVAVDYCDASTCRPLYPSLSTTRVALAGAGLAGGLAMFVGGNTYTNAVEVCDRNNGCQQVLPGLHPAALYIAGAATKNGVAIFAGGYSSQRPPAVDNAYFCTAAAGCSSTVATGGGDPVFVGFDGIRFNFAGTAGEVFHVFSDSQIAVNALFVHANPATRKGTVMSAIGVRWANASITIDVESFVTTGDSKNASVTILLTNHSTTTPHQRTVTLRAVRTKGDTVTTLDECVRATLIAPDLVRLVTSQHRVDVRLRVEHTQHINRTYINLALAASHGDSDLLGGLLGDTTVDGRNAAPPLKRTVERYVVKAASANDANNDLGATLVSLKSATNRFAASPFCTDLSGRKLRTALGGEHLHH